jgi:hypothetical protein
MQIDLSNPDWIAVLVTVLMAIIGATFAITRALYAKNASKSRQKGSSLSEDQLLTLLSIYQDAVTNEIAKKMIMFFYTAHVRRKHVDDAKLHALKTELTTLVRVRREQLRVFPLPVERLDEFIGRIYDQQLEKDAESLFAIAQREQPYLERVQQVEKELRRIQLEIRQRIRQSLPSAIRR